jgi:hypothetical protein
MLIYPGRPSVNALLWWVLAESGVPLRFQLDDPGAGPNLHSWPLKLPSDNLPGYDLHVVTAQGLDAGTRYVLTALAGGQTLSAESRTLPAGLPADRPFTVALGSCYCLATDRKHGAPLHACYPPALHDGEADPVRLRFLCGDQIYMDLSEHSGLPLVFDAPDPWRRYFDQWRDPDFASFFRRSPNLVMADDHEFWNDYPHGNAWLRWPGPQAGQGLDRLYSLFQAALNLDPATLADHAQDLQALLTNQARTFAIEVNPLSFFVLDTRSRRRRFDDRQPSFTEPGWLDQALAWLRQLTGPGVLVVSQPMIEQPASWFQRLSHTMGDVNLPDYGEQYAALWEGILGAPHDVVVATGDIHWNRFCLITPPGGSEVKACEVVSSPLSRIIETPHAVASEPGHGRVKWNHGARSANWVLMYAGNQTPTYATLSFDRRGTQIRLETRWWGPDPNRPGTPVQVGSTESYLK